MQNNSFCKLRNFSFRFVSKSSPPLTSVPLLHRRYNSKRKILFYVSINVPFIILLLSSSGALYVVIFSLHDKFSFIIPLNKAARFQKQSFFLVFHVASRMSCRLARGNQSGASVWRKLFCLCGFIAGSNEKRFRRFSTNDSDCVGERKAFANVIKIMSPHCDGAIDRLNEHSAKHQLALHNKSQENYPLIVKRFSFVKNNNSVVYLCSKQGLIERVHFERLDFMCGRGRERDSRSICWARDETRVEDKLTEFFMIF